MARLDLSAQDHGLLHVGAARIEGPLVVVERVRDVGFDEVVEILDPAGQPRLGRVLDVSAREAVVQVLEEPVGLAPGRAAVAAIGNPTNYTSTIAVPSRTNALPAEGVFPDGTKVKLSPDRDPREVFAEWLIRPDNAWFSRTIVNRVWAWLMGPFLTAYVRVHGDAGREQARKWLAGFGKHLSEAGLGQVSEIFDGEPLWA